ncbi:MAG: right-handed parallel beta-helix repeat-containing protein [Chloroflexi bacterium]|nr:right-handed parallel beta-helix repeat-containing protein [Chloroflexota bacterium]MCI0579600.1 right-handed parallel beta-helix repeat-containing protein [Chloroflexota bacterium]MCI0644839.1 right-handed parallel beta-helix repeat-containing protein [Chloroflexota bacterium]MCI0731435.1 right-handed parallel beta-helix repeat-containing protein [Chloroflexota bacterium]
MKIKRAIALAACMVVLLVVTIVLEAPDTLAGPGAPFWDTGRNPLSSAHSKGNVLAFLPFVVTPFTVNSTVDAVDNSPGDGRCETAPGNRICTLRAAIQETNALPGTDTILLPANTYVLTLAGSNEDGATAGDLDVTDALNLRGTNSSNTIVNGNDIDRVFHVISASVLISDLTITNGRVDTTDQGGGGIYNEPGSVLTLERLTVSNNEAIGSGSSGSLYGGGIYNRGSLTINNSAIVNNVLTNLSYGGSGGGITSSSGTVSITNSSISNNVVNSGTEGGGLSIGDTNLLLTNVVIENNTIVPSTLLNPIGGGGITISGGNATLQGCSIVGNSTTRSEGGGIYGSSNGNITINNCLIANNSAMDNTTTASNGGGIFYDGHGNFTINNSIIQNNYAGSAGGGLYYEPMFIIGQLFINNTTFTQNQAEFFGAAIYNRGNMSLTNATLSGNQAIGIGNKWGGAIYQASYNLSVLNSTITANEARLGGGIYTSGGTISLKNSIIALNNATDPLGGDNCDGVVVSSGNNLEDKTSCNLSAPGDLSNTNPLLGPLLNNGGPTPTHALQPSSPAIDTADNGPCPSTDQRGFPRPVDGNGDTTVVCDIGAYEYTP